ncbi:UPF0415 protein C7orf25 homolog isoform X1 [Homarus americanus]|uniref:UPF0415 protein C7orf25 homolog isoform X1 n=1 Tax=Homarus americanus TaxID=6706 RepID=UPI001C47B359|nr:UPF0415 protein C7orf25 homolog isoform X1 [Homarus americanus]
MLNKMTGGRTAELALNRINDAKQVLDQIFDLEKKSVNGTGKLKKRIQAEINFLKKGLEKGSELKEEHVLCSNLGQLGALSSVAVATHDVTGLLQTFCVGGSEKIVVDVVGDGGKQWIKVLYIVKILIILWHVYTVDKILNISALLGLTSFTTITDGPCSFGKVILRNPKALHLLFILGGRNGVKPLDEVAEDFIICAQKHPVFYSNPQVVFWFCGGVSESLANDLEEKGVEVKGKKIPDHELGLPDYFGEDSEAESEDSEVESEEDSEVESEEDSEVDSEDSELESEEDSEVESEEDSEVESEEDSETENEDSSSGYEYSSDSEEENKVKVMARNRVDKTVIEKNITNEIMNIVSMGYVGQENNTLDIFSLEEADLKSKPDHTQKIISSEVLESEKEYFSGQYTKSQSHADKEETIDKVNLDVTAMIAYVSATANGRANFVFKDKFLAEQAVCERKNPVKETLNGYFKGKELLACREAVIHFLDIVKTIGGESEKVRAEELVSRLTIVEGEDYLKEKVKLGGKVRELSRIIFGTGQVHRAITITSNGGFVRSAEHQGVKLAVLYHKPRALTEAKESSAVPL